MTIGVVTAVDDALFEAVARLVPQLSPNRPLPTRDELEELCAESGTSLLVARDGNTILGILTLVTYRIPIGRRGEIHTVIVDEAARGRGIGEALTNEALRLAQAAGVDEVQLTSRPQREAANRLYQRLGFSLHETNVYVWRPG